MSVTLRNQLATTNQYYLEDPPTGPITYNDLGIIGMGSYSNVFRVERSGNASKWALKWPKNSTNQDMLKCNTKEAKILRVLNEAEKKEGSQTYVIQLIALFTIEEGKIQNIPIMLFPFYRSNLHFFAKKGLSVEKTICIAKQMFETLSFLKRHRVVHRDIKPANILVVQEAEIRLADFGAAMIKGQPSESGFWGGPRDFKSPEILISEDPNNAYDFPSDMWAFGCTLFEVLFRERPFVTKSDAPAELVEMHRKFNDVFEAKWAGLEDVSNEASFSVLKGLFKQTLEPDPEKRLPSEAGSEMLKDLTV